jgi:hypothetical protein
LLLGQRVRKNAQQSHAILAQVTTPMQYCRNNILSHLVRAHLSPVHKHTLNQSMVLAGVEGPGPRVKWNKNSLGCWGLSCLCQDTLRQDSEANLKLFLVKQSFFKNFVDITLLSSSFPINFHISIIFLHW